ncbi:MAG: TauD/TfdA family dioxygenase, partial [Alphaproteobacteria bacterium]|nr:TauD/TfdA family dioxygenase [Alphaproteobacteria bacterium]MBV9965792.1 TauD/TfdA family dioxygenase [Alphaproteobacteria bacterium]
MRVVPSGETMGATIEGVDLARPLGRREFGEILRALGDYSVLRFPEQKLDAAQLK